MSFAAIRAIANSSLMATSVQMQVTSANIANADVAGYTAKTATQSAAVSGGVASGTSVTAIGSDVDKYLLRDLVAAASTLGAADATNTKADSLQGLFGSTVGSDDDSGTSLANAIDTLQTSLTSLSGTVESSALSSLTVNALDDLASQLRETSSSIQGLRADADGEIADAVTSVNTALDTIGSLNDQIVAAKALGQSTADLEDQRNTALQTVAQQMNVSYVVKSNGQMLISTASGTPLVDSTVHALGYTSAATVTADTVFAGITVGGKDVSSEITSGAIGGLLAARDTTLPGAEATLDTLASTLIDTLNSVYNQGTSVPPPSTLTGTTSVSSSDALSATGTLRITLTNNDGTTNSSTDLDLAAYSTVGDLVTALNGISGVSASVSSGKLIISSTNTSLGTAVGGGAVGSQDQSVSDYFGLNDLLTGSSAANIAVRSDILSGKTALASGTLDTTSTLTAGSKAVSTSSSFVASIQSALEANHNFAASGTLASTTTTLAGYAADLVSSVASTASSASSKLDTVQSNYNSYSDAMSSATGVNVDEETARMSELEQQYSVAAQLLEVLNQMFDALLTAARSSS